MRPSHHEPTPARSDTARRRLLIFDVDGTVAGREGVFPEAASILSWARSCGAEIRFLTNDAVQGPAARARQLKPSLPFVTESMCYTASMLAVRWLVLNGNPKVFFVGERRGLRREMQQLHLVVDKPEIVLMGHLCEFPTTRVAQSILEAVRGGALLTAMQSNRLFSDGVSVSPDVGCWVNAIEMFTGQKAHVFGKPSSWAFVCVCSDAGVSPTEAVMIGDNWDVDIVPALRLGMTAIHLRAGKQHTECDTRWESCGRLMFARHFSELRSHLKKLLVLE